MTPAPSFVHPAPDPSPEVAERVLPRVEATVRRRRARRRAALTAVPVALVVVALLAVAASTTGGDDDEVVTATEPAPTTTTGPPVDQLSFDPDTGWAMPTLSADDRTLTISVTEPCRGRIVHEVVETPDAVVVGVQTLGDEEPLGPNEACALMLRIKRIVVTLREPLGERPLYDGNGRAPRDDLLRQAALVEVADVPGGFAADEPDMTSAGEPWQQTFRAPGADWYFAVNQVATADADQWYGDDEGTPLTVGGRPAELITGQMNGTMETIRFELGDLTISVWGEMQGPPAFTHRDELVRIAEGVQLPEG